MIKYLDLQKVNNKYVKELKKVASDIIDSGWYLLGEKVETFEKELAEYIGVKYIVGVGSGLDALRLILEAYKIIGLIKENDEVIVPANTFIASVLAITHARLKPVFVEPNIYTYNMDLSQVEQLITPKTKAIMLVHLYGRVCWNEQIEKLARKYNLRIIEDNAQAIGAIYKDRKTGSLGDAAAFSFYPGKNLGALADAGVVATQNSELAKVLREIRNYGSERKYYYRYQGYNSRMSELQAAFLSVKLKKLDEDNAVRRQIAWYYHQNIKNDSVILPSGGDGDIRENLQHVWHIFAVRCKSREQLQNHLKRHEIQTNIHYPIPLHKQEAYKQWNNLKFPITEKIHHEVLSLPLNQVLETYEREIIVDAVNSFKLFTK